MGDKSAIQWTDATWNPVTGCSKVSPGCAHCYAETVTAKYAGRKGFIAEHRPWTPGNAEHNVTLWPERLEVPLRWRRPRMVFVNSMSDLFHEQVPDEYIADVFEVMRLADRHIFQVLTKRPERMRDWMRHKYVMPNVWLGVSIENRRFVHRADLLRETPAAVRFISAEPLLGPLIGDMTGIGWPGAEHAWMDDYYGPGLDLDGIDWLIVGGESGPRHRPIDPEWVKDLQLQAHIAETAFFFKQWGGRTPKSGGRELDGRTWDEMPRAVALLEASHGD